MAEPEPIWRRYLRFFGPNIGADVEDELRFHFEERIAALMAEGLDRESASRAATAEFGDVAAVRRDLATIDRRVDRRHRFITRVTGAFQGLGLDIRSAVRGFRANPGLVAAAAGSLALAIGVNVTTFAAVDRIGLRPFDVPAGDRLVRVATTVPKDGISSSPTSLPDFIEWRTRAKTASLAGYVQTGYNWSSNDQAERVWGAQISAGFFSLMGVTVIAGREFNREDEESGERLALIGERIWRDRYGGRLDIIGRTATLDGVAHVIVGVIPSRYVFPFVDGGEVWTPLANAPAATRYFHQVWVIGGLAPGSSVAAAQAELGTIARRLAELFPDSNAGYEARVETAWDAAVSPDARRAVVLFMGSIGLVLLIACANVANLLLARGVARSREIAIRSAVGAKRGRIVRLLMIENLALAALGGIGGVLLSVGGVAWLRRSFGPNLLGQAPPFELSSRALGYAAIVTVAAAIIFGLLPAFRAGATNLIGTLREGGRGESSSPALGRMRGSLVAAEMALSVVLLVSAGLTLKASYRINQADLGLDRRRGIVFSTVMAGLQSADTVGRLALQDRLAARLRAIPGVTASGLGSELPLDGSGSSKYAVEGEDSVAYLKLPGAQYHMVGPGFAEAVGIRLQAGRFFTRDDRRNAPLVAIVNDALMKRHWPSASGALGRRIRFWDKSYEIVGVAASIHEWGIQNGAPAAVYLSAAQVPVSWNSYVLSSARSLGDLTVEVRRAVAAEAPGQPIYRVMSLEDYVAHGYREPRILAAMLTLMAVVALTLATMGVASVVGYAVAQRTKELGIRRALGASAKQIVATVARQSGKAVAIGTAIGLALALGTGQLVAGFLNGASPFDPLVFAGVGIVLLAAAAVSMVVPARRAVRVDPMVTLRNE